MLIELLLVQLSWSIGDECKSSRQYESAIRAYEFVFSAGPFKMGRWSPSEEPDTEALLLRNLGDCSKGVEKYDRAAIYYLSALNCSTAPSHIHECLGALYYSQGIYNESIEHYIRSMDLNPTEAISIQLANAYIAAGAAVLAIGDPDGAINLYQNAIGVNPARAQAWQGCGNAYLSKRDYVGAIRTFKDAREKFPSHEGIHDGLRNALLAADNAEAAVWVYKADMMDVLIAEYILKSENNAHAS